MLRAKELRMVREYELTNYSIDPNFLVMAVLVAVALPIHLLMFLLGKPIDPALEAKIAKYYGKF